MAVLKGDEHHGGGPGSNLIVLTGYAPGDRPDRNRGGVGFALTRHSEEVSGAPMREQEKQRKERQKERRQQVKWKIEESERLL